MSCLGRVNGHRRVKQRFLRKSDGAIGANRPREIGLRKG